MLRRRKPGGAWPISILGILCFGEFGSRLILSVRAKTPRYEGSPAGTLPKGILAYCRSS